MKKALIPLVVLVFLLSCKALPTLSENEKNEYYSSETLTEFDETATLIQSTSDEIELSATDKRFFGTWSVKDVKVGDAIVFALDQIVLFREDLQFHELSIGSSLNNEGGWSYAYCDTFHEGIDQTWKADDEFLYLYYDEEERYKLKYSFVDEKTLLLTMKEGNQLTYTKIGNETLTTLQKAMSGTWECPYKAEYGEIASAQIICDDIGLCAGESEIKSSEGFTAYDGNTYKISTFYYIGSNQIIENPNSLISDYADNFSGEFMIIGYPYSIGSEGCKSPDYSFTNDLMSEFTAIGKCGDLDPGIGGNAAYWGYFATCKKISD